MIICIKAFRGYNSCYVYVDLEGDSKIVEGSIKERIEDGSWVQYKYKGMKQRFLHKQNEPERRLFGKPFYRHRIGTGNDILWMNQVACCDSTEYDTACKTDIVAKAIKSVQGTGLTIPWKWILIGLGALAVAYYLFGGGVNG